MIGRARRWRLLAVLLLLATPGLAGTVLDGLHPCPENAPWVAAESSAADHGSHAAHGGSDGEAPAHAAECHCLGACVGAAATIPFTAALPTVASEPAPADPVRPAPADLPASRPSDLLPPSTAPPLA